ncbi:MAG: GNAT family N-acetyltransferase [Clostridia bacterium]|nr:GNAT family N-acetyltransferase [Clostridia bacterium]
MVRTEIEFESVAKDPASDICIAAELYLPDDGEPVLSVLPSLDISEITADENGFSRAAKLSAPILERFGFDTESEIYDFAEFESSNAALQYSGTVNVVDGAEPYAEATVGGVPVSFASVNDLPEEDGKVEIYVQTEEEYRSQGYGTRCVSALRDLIVNKGKTAKYVTETDNAPSLRVAEKAGFIKTGRRLTAGFYRKGGE